MCDTVFTLQPLLYRHFDQHIENQKVSVFKCPDCSLLYAQKQLMMDHIKVCGHLFLRYYLLCNILFEKNTFLKVQNYKKAAGKKC